jgi:hypothetical protein
MIKISPFKGELSFFVPGIVLLIVGMAMVALPKLFIYLIAGVLVFTGVLLISLAAKFLIYKERFTRTFSAKVVLHPSEPQNRDVHGEVVNDEINIKKVILH